MPILILALAGAQGPADADSLGERPQLTEMRVPAGAVTASYSGGSIDVSGLRVEDLIMDHVDPTDVRSHPDAVRAFIRATSGVTLPDLRPQHSADAIGGTLPGTDASHFDEPDPSEETSEPEETGTISHASPGGDLNGDGMEDVLVFELTLPEETIVIRALKGTDGAEIWQRDLDAADAVGFPVGDLTGDGIDDLLLWTFEVLEEAEVEECPDASYCRYQYDASYDWVVGLRSGTDGKRVWATRYAGEDHYLYLHEIEGTPPATYTAREQESYESPNYSVFPYVSGDHDGDSLDDILLESIDIDFLYENEEESTGDVVFQDTGQVSLHGATRAQVTRGRDGTALASRGSEMGPGVALLQPVDDLVGSSAPDLLWEESTVPDSAYSCLTVVAVEDCADDPEEGYALELELVDGNSLEPAWHVSVDGVVDGFSVGLPEDVTGDGVDDVLVFAFVEQEFPFVLRLLSGADGTRAWTRSQRASSDFWEFPVLLEDLTGDGVSDLV
ncbi:MAG: hypothetical protein ACRDHM_10940, partial [Actinomycetota bacterium]